MGWMTEESKFESWKCQAFSLPQVIYNDSQTHLASCPMGIGGGGAELSLGVKRLQCKAEHSPPTSARVKKMWVYTSNPPYTFIV
jgi:hypothetical protein